MPEPLSPKIGLGMKVTVMPWRFATFLQMYLYQVSQSDILTSGLKAHVDFGLAGGGDFVMLLLDPDADLLHLQHHFGADVLQRVGWRYREVAFLVARLVAQIGAFLAAVPDAFFGFDEVVAGVLVGVEADAVEDEELRLGAEIGGIADSG